MADQRRYNREFADRFVLTCCAFDMSKDKLMTKTGFLKSRVNHYEQGQIPPRKAFAEIAKAFDIPSAWLSMWLMDGDRKALNRYDNDTIKRFEDLPVEEQTRRANALGWLQQHGRPPKVRPPE